MNMTKAELRASLTEKLNHRRELMGQNSQLRGDVRREKERNRFLLSTIANPLVDMVLEDCADQIMKSIINEAVRASEIVANETIDTGNYEIGISIPSLHIRHRLMRMDVNDAASFRYRQISKINIHNGETSS